MPITVNLPPREGAGIADLEAAEAAAIDAIEAQEATSVAAVAAAVSAKVVESATGPSGDLYVATQDSIDDIEAAAAVVLAPTTGTLDVAEAAAIAAVAAQGVTSAGVVDAAALARLTQIALAAGHKLYPTTAAALSNGVIGFTGLTGGSGGTNGTFNLAFSGGAGVNAGGRFVVSGGALVSAFLRNSGDSYTSAPTISLAASSGLTGASLTAVIGPNVSVGDFFFTPGADGKSLLGWEVTAGPVATARPDLDQYTSNPADPQTERLVQARLETQEGRGLRDYPDLLPVRMYMGTLSGGATKNADGSYNFPPGGRWTSANLAGGVFDVPGNIFAYLPLTTPDTGVMQIRVMFAGVTIAAGNTTTEPQAGVCRQTWSNTFPRPYVTVILENVHASKTVNTYGLEMYQTDSAYLPQILRYDDVTPVTDHRPALQDEFLCQRRWSSAHRRGQGEGNIAKSFNSAAGSDAAAGTRWAPKQNLSAGTTLAAGDVVGLSGEWNAQKIEGLGTTTAGLVIKGQFDNKDPVYPRLWGSSDVTAQSWTLESGTTWKTTVVMTTGVLNDGYSTLSVLRTLLSAAAATPLAAERLMKQATSKANCIATTDSSFFELVSGLTYTLYVNTPDGLAPNLGGYSYRANRAFAAMVWGQNQDRPGGNVYDLEISHWNAGLGAVNGGKNIWYEGLIISHGTKHSLNIGGGGVRDFLCYGRGAPNNNALNAYHPDATGLSSVFTNGVVDIDDGSPIYTHRGGSGNYDYHEVSHLIIRADRAASGALQISDSFACDNVTKALYEWNYVRGIGASNAGAGNHIDPCDAIYRYNLYDKTAYFNSMKDTYENVCVLENFSYDANLTGIIVARLNENHQVHNNTMLALNVQTTYGDANPTTDYRVKIYDVPSTGNNNPGCHHNLIVIDTPRANGVTIRSEQGAGITFTADYNIIVNFTPGSMASFKWGGGGTKLTWAEYLADFAPNDANSVFYDCRDDPRGAYALFKDPLARNLEFADTELARKVQADMLRMGAGASWTIKSLPAATTADEDRVALMRS